MKTPMFELKPFIACLAALVCAGPVWALDVGSSGADGAFDPAVSTDLQLPPSGVLNFTTVNVRSGVTVRFKRNTANTPVVILATGNVSIAGIVDVSGDAAPAAGTAGNGAIGDDGQPGKGGPGGFDGGAGASATATAGTKGGYGLGPGGGGYGESSFPSWPCANSSGGNVGGSGGSYATAGSNNSTASFTCGAYSFTQQPAGTTYGSPQLLPLIGGSGGGGGGGGATFDGAGGGGGGGAILIASNATVNITGSLLANGGKGGDTGGSGGGAAGGGGSGGAIRIVADTISGNGTLNAKPGAAGAVGTTTGYTTSGAGAGGYGRIRLEANSITRNGPIDPIASADLPGPVQVAGLPTLTITSVAGVAAPANPTGVADITLPANTPNPVTVTFSTTSVPPGNTVKLTVTPTNGSPLVVVSPALTGSTASATASVQAALPVGPSVLQATTTYTIVASLGDSLSRYAQGERVERIRLEAVLGGPGTVVLVTASGKEFEVPAALLATLQQGG
jgi:hypothetical protein